MRTMNAFYYILATVSFQITLNNQVASLAHFSAHCEREERKRREGGGKRENDRGKRKTEKIT